MNEVILARLTAAETERDQLRAQLAQLQKAARLFLEFEDMSGRLQHNIGVPCGLCEAHTQIKAALADLPDAPKEKP